LCFAKARASITSGYALGKWVECEVMEILNWEINRKLCRIWSTESVQSTCERAEVRAGEWTVHFYRCELMSHVQTQNTTKMLGDLIRESVNFLRGVNRRWWSISRRLCSSKSESGLYPEQ
jgi:hypothetical protein